MTAVIWSNRTCLVHSPQTVYLKFWSPTPSACALTPSPLAINLSGHYLNISQTINITEQLVVLLLSVKFKPCYFHFFFPLLLLGSIGIERNTCIGNLLIKTKIYFRKIFQMCTKTYNLTCDYIKPCISLKQTNIPSQTDPILTYIGLT